MGTLRREPIETAGREVVCAVPSLSDFRLARLRSLSHSAWRPRAAPDHARALDDDAADFYLVGAGAGAGAAAELWGTRKSSFWGGMRSQIGRFNKSSRALQPG
jgi:hypothetical protein